MIASNTEFFGHVCCFHHKQTLQKISEYQLIWSPLVTIYHRHGWNEKIEQTTLPIQVV